MIRSSQPGSHQFADPNTCISAGTSTVRSTNASMATATARSIPKLGDHPFATEDESPEHKDHDQRGRAVIFGVTDTEESRWLPARSDARNGKVRRPPGAADPFQLRADALRVAFVGDRPDLSSHSWIPPRPQETRHEMVKLCAIRRRAGPFEYS
jgi:hypothetical protein